ncbi:solute carrier family 35 member B1 [Hydra vulgaris]|uniref:solute carrier family 35 member B1 n=1 Tax=Hydra vulgaris TaxID=6087 RepID=UPI001F5E3F03|nr:solute carrier family 35 member B1-like [Hydra vulgaris]
MLFKLCVCFLGVFLGYLANGIVNEVITTRFGKEVFDFYLTMLIVPALCNAICARLILLTISNPKEMIVKSDVPERLYLGCSILNMLSMMCSFFALFYVSYPTQLILKSSKPISILVFGYFTNKKAYPLYRFLSIFLTVTGVMSFMCFEYKMQDLAGAKNGVQHYVSYGCLLILFSLILDGILASIQDIMKRDYSIEAHKLMYFTNKYSFLILGTIMLFTNEFKDFYIYAEKFPLVLLYTLILGLTSAFGQNFIYFSIAWFGPLTCAVITTTRKFFNVLISVFVFSHNLKAEQWMSVVLIFIGLFFDIWIQRSI